MSRQVSQGSSVEYHADEQAGVPLLSWRVSGRFFGRCRGAQLVRIRQMSRRVSRGSAGVIKQKSTQVSRGSAGQYQADEQVGVTGLSWRVTSRRAGRCRAAHLGSIRQMSRQVSRGSAGEYQADEQAGVARLNWRVSGR